MTTEILLERIKTLILMMGFNDVEVTLDEPRRRVSIVITDRLVEDGTAPFLVAVDHVVNLMLRKENLPSFVVDVNYYRKERERLITELARAAAKKAMISKTEVELPPMNAYERRLVHMEITTHPELTTESTGVGKERRVVIKHVQ